MLIASVSDFRKNIIIYETNGSIIQKIIIKKDKNQPL